MLQQPFFWPFFDYGMTRLRTFSNSCLKHRNFGDSTLRPQTGKTCSQTLARRQQPLADGRADQPLGYGIQRNA